MRCAAVPAACAGSRTSTTLNDFAPGVVIAPQGGGTSAEHQLCPCTLQQDIKMAEVSLPYQRWATLAAAATGDERAARRRWKWRRRLVTNRQSASISTQFSVQRCSALQWHTQRSCRCHWVVCQIDVLQRAAGCCGQAPTGSKFPVCCLHVATQQISGCSIQVCCWLVKQNGKQGGPRTA